MNTDTGIIFSELYGFLIFMGNEYIDKLPINFFNMIKENRNTNLNLTYNSSNTENLNKETINLISLLYLNYWCESELEKNEFIVTLNNNEKQFQEKQLELYNPAKIFKNNKKENINLTNETSLVIVKESFFAKLFSRIKSLFNRHS